MTSEPIRFPTTSWTVVFGAVGEDARRSALQILCESYWPPVYAFFLRQVGDPEEAKDLTQGFFARMLEKRDLYLDRKPDSRFRWYLIACAKHFRANELDRNRAQKRGGGLVTVNLDMEVPGALSLLEDHGGKTPEQIFEKRWALLMIERAVRAVRKQYEASGQGAVFGLLKSHLAEGDGRGYRDVANELGTSESAVKMAVHRIRRRFADALRAEIGLTVADPGDIQSEIEYLLSVLRS
jgi:RNA polymerase sigma factor (sigma-70 family)